MKFDQHLLLWLCFACAAAIIDVVAVSKMRCGMGKTVDDCDDKAAVIANSLNQIFCSSFVPHNISVGLTVNYKILTEEAHRLVDNVMRIFMVKRRTTLPKLVGEHLSMGNAAVYVSVQIVFIESVDQILFFHKANARWQSSFLIVLISVQSSKRVKVLELMSEIFAHFMHEHYIINVNILTHVSDGCMTDLYTFFPYTATRCESTEPALLWRYNGSNAYTERHIALQKLFPDKLTNLHGCPLRVIVWHIPPFIELCGTATNVTQIMGLDAVILKTVATKLNFTIELLPNEPPNLMGGFVHPNGTMTGAYKMVYERRANITVGCTACTPERTAYLTPTWAYYQMQYIIVLNMSTRYSAYEIMLFPFDIWTWLLVVLLAVLRLFYRSRNETDAGTGQVARLLQGVWLVLFFVLRSAYEGSIFEFVHSSPIKPMPRTLDQVVDQNYKVITDHATYRMTLTMPRMLAITSTVPGDTIELFEALRLRSTSTSASTRRTGAFTSKMFFAYYLTKQRQQRANYLILRDPIVNNMVCMYFPRDSYMERTVSRQLRHLRSSGLIFKYSKIADFANLPPTTASSRRANSLSQHTDIFDDESKHFVIAACKSLLVAYAFASLVFVLEHMSRRLKCMARLFLYF